MNKLIKNELTKSFKKKNIYITLGIFTALLILFACIYKWGMDSSVTYEISSENEQYYTESIQKLNPNNSDDVELYVEYQTELDKISLLKEYETNSWQQYVIMNSVIPIIQNINHEKYISKDDSRLAEYEAQLEEYKVKFDNNDWKSFVSSEKELKEDDLKSINTQLASESNKSIISTLKKEKESLETELFILNYRLENDVAYGDNYLNTALSNYSSALNAMASYDPDNLSDDEEKEYKSYQAEAAESKYELENKVDNDSYKSARNLFMTVISDNQTFIIIITIMIAGAIVAEEFNKGTIKQLLTRPYKRSEILLSKLITSILIMLGATLFLIIAQYIIGGLFFGFDTYSIPAVVYNFANSEIQEINMIAYIATQFIAILPELLLLTTVAFAISTILTSTPLAIIISLLISIFSGLVNQLIIMSKIELFKFFPTMCWDLTPFLYGGTSDFKYSSFGLSLSMSIIYLVIILFVTFFVFKRKNVKNI